MANNKSETLVLLCSPQYVADMPAFLSALLKCRYQQTLRLVTIGKAHLFVMHGFTFRQPIRLFRDVLFAQLYAPSSSYYPLILAMTAMMPASLLQPFLSMIHVNFMLAHHKMLASALDFQQHAIRIVLLQSLRMIRKKGRCGQSFNCSKPT